MRLKYFIYILMFLTLSCVKEQEAIVPEGTVTATIPYKAVVQGSELTRASITGDFGTGSYIFQTGDKLYISYEEDETVKLYGFLNLMSGEGTGAGTFGGTLNCVGGYLPTNNPEVSATLVGLGQDQAEEPATPFFTFSENRIIANYPSEIPFEAGGLAEYVKKYSHFTATNNFDAKSFTLEQQAVFLNFNINLLTSSMTGSPSTVDVDIKSAEGSSTLHRVTSVPVGGSAFMASMVFSTVVPKGSSLRGAQIVVDNGDGIHCEPDFADDEYFVLLANKYYTVARTNVDPFTVEAPTGATITYKFGTNTEYKKYSGGEWGEWTSYSEPIDLSAGDKVSFRGKNNSYANTGGSTPLFTTTNPVDIYGDIMSLMCDDNWVRGSAVGEQAFYQAFKGVAVDIPNDKELILSATTLGTSCYEGMFQNCTDLTRTPILPATTLAASCYQAMFKGCSSLETASPIYATTLEDKSCKQMFMSCTMLSTAPTMTINTLNGTDNCSEMFGGVLTVDDSKYTYSVTNGCDNLQDISNIHLSATELTSACYYGMFMGSAVSSVPNGFLPAENLAVACYMQMFLSCKQLTHVPSNLLPALALKNGCYANMFRGCSSLVDPPDLEATTPFPGCYFGMFRQCTSLTHMKCLIILGTDQQNKTRPGAITDTGFPMPGVVANWTHINAWTVFNKWLDKAKNVDTGELIYNSAMPTPNAVYTNGQDVGKVPALWKRTAYPPTP